MRALKTKFPCRDCGTPAEVGSLCEKDHARCPRCRERTRLLRLAQWADDESNRYFEAVADDHESPEAARMARYLRAAEERVQAARWLAEAVAHALPGERHQFIRIAQARAAWAASVLSKMGLLAGAAIREETGLEPLDGGCEVSPPRLPALRLVGDAEKPPVGNGP